jgi:hypothetical protein
MSNITVEKMLIHNYGLFWDRDKTDWGWPKHTGRLLGVKASAKKTKPVDFWIQQGIYALYDSAFNLVYIGQTGAKKQKLLAR